MRNKSSSQITILSEAFLSFSGMTLGSVFRYIFSIVMARFLGAQMLGIYSLGNAVTRIAEIFALMGLDNGVLRFVSRDTENKENVKNSIYWSLKFGFLSSIIISIILFCSAEFIVNNLLNEDNFLVNDQGIKVEPYYSGDGPPAVDFTRNTGLDRHQGMSDYRYTHRDARHNGVNLHGAPQPFVNGNPFGLSDTGPAMEQNRYDSGM